MKSCLVGIAKNEGPFIFEWCLYHAFNGFDAVVVYDNNSTDDTGEQVNLASKFADVRLVDWPLHPGQIEAYEHAMGSLRPQFDVFCMLDIDEFLVAPQHPNLSGLLSMAMEYPLIAVNWIYFGSSGHVQRPSGLVLENYTRRAAKGNSHVKSIIGPGAANSHFLNPHFLDPGDYVDASGTPITWNPTKRGRTNGARHLDLARIQHYYTRSRQDYDAKLARGRATSNKMRADTFVAHDLNDVEDRTVENLYGVVLERIRQAARDAAGCKL